MPPPRGSHASGITQPGGPPVQWRGWRAAIVGEGGAEVGYVELTFLQAPEPMAALGGGRATLTGHMTLADRAFDIVHLDGTTHAVYERVPDWSTPPEVAAGARELPATESRLAQPGAELGQTSGELSAQSAPEVDVLVVYTQGAKAEVANIYQLATDDINRMQMAVSASWADVVVNLVGVRRVEFGEDPGEEGMGFDLDYLTFADTAIDEVREWRDQLGADVVHLYGRGWTDCGLGWRPGTWSTGNAAFGYSLSDVTKCLDGHTLAHEVGHNLSLRHDLFTQQDQGQATGPSPVDYNFGFQDDGYRHTVMAYPCPPAPCDPLTPYFSNPGISIGGRAIGSSTANNAQSLYGSGPPTADFRSGPSGPFADGPYWVEWTIARGLDRRQAGGSYFLDGFGGLHERGGAPAIANGPYWSGWDIARDLATAPVTEPTTSGVTLDGFGGRQAWGSTGPINTGGGPYWGWDIARGVALVAVGGGWGGYVLDGWGGIHPFGGAPAPPSGAPYWPGWDIARDLAMVPGGQGGYVLDGWGGVHAFGSVPPVSNPAMVTGLDRFRSITLELDAGGGVSGAWAADHYGGTYRLNVG